MVTRRRLVVAVALTLLALPAIALLGRDAPFLGVRDVRVTGLHGKDAPEIRKALTAAAREMTTLHLDEDALRAAVRRYPTVRGIEVERDLPRAVRIDVRERLPVASVGGVAVAADGRVLRGVPAEGLPTVAGARPPAGTQVTDRQALALVAMLGAAPAALRDRADQALVSDRGPAVELRDGPILFFGDTRRPRAKWLAAAAVLSSPRSAGAGYLDLRRPERPAAGAPEASMNG